ncbi:MAG TPA: YbjN domain-containing protein [Acidimicrobiales bacterium]|nr:YbjN domain-containing protein [Acidimicrobiales bacterium]
MPLARISTPEEAAACGQVIEHWSAARLAEGGALVAVDRQPDAARWYLRLAGDDKDFVTVWLTVRQRTLHHEAQVMPAPDTEVERVYEYLLRRNADLHQMRFALGAEDAVYLVGEMPVADVCDDELDRIIGSSLAYVDDVFPTVMEIGFAGRYRARRRGPQGPRR